MDTPLFYSVKDTARLLGISRASVFILLRDGKLRGAKLGGKRLISRDEIERFAASLPREYRGRS